jgi:hypothetical protein
LQAVALILAAKDGKRAVYLAGSPLKAWDALKEAAATLAIGDEITLNHTHRVMTIGAGSVRVVGVDDHDRLRGNEIDAVVAGARTPQIERTIGPRLSEAGWVVYVDEAADHAEWTSRRFVPCTAQGGEVKP